MRVDRALDQDSLFFHDEKNPLTAKSAIHPCRGVVPPAKNQPAFIQPQDHLSVSRRKVKKNVFFLKTHKTASSTVQNILMRFGLRHSLNFMLPKKANYLGYSRPIKLDDLDFDSIPSDKKFNIFTHHSRYNHNASQYLYSDVTRVTILRDPPELFESLFNFYKFTKVLKLSFRRFVESPLSKNRDLKMSSKRKIQLRNQMSRDLGLDSSNYQNRTEILRFIRFVDKEFDLVMIREHMEASLVLFASLMEWPLHYVSSIPLNARKDTNKIELSAADRDKLQQYNYADHLLYHHFLKKFRSQVLDYGFEKMVQDVQKLHSMNAELRKRCILKENDNGFYHTINYVLKEDCDWECEYATKPELTFTNELRKEQIERLKPVKRLESLIRIRSFER